VKIEGSHNNLYNNHFKEQSLLSLSEISAVIINVAVLNIIGAYLFSCMTNLKECKHKMIKMVSPAV